MNRTVAPITTDGLTKLRELMWRMRPTTLAAIVVDLHDDTCDEYGMTVADLAHQMLKANVGCEDAKSMLEIARFIGGTEVLDEVPQ